jgi:hypothetical protein
LLEELVLKMKASTHRLLVWSLLALGAGHTLLAWLGDPLHNPHAVWPSAPEWTGLFLFAAGYVAAAGWWSTRKKR